jgi:autotransporter-associated beta strand protein
MAMNPTGLSGRAALFCAAVALLLSAHPKAGAATVVKADNTTDLNQGASWVGSVAPGTNDVAKWDATITTANAVNLGADLAWSGLSLGTPGGAVTIGGGNILSLGTGGIDMSAAGQNLTISSSLALLPGNQIWNVASGRILTLSTGTFTRATGSAVSLQGSGSVADSMNALANDNSGLIGPWMTIGTGSSTAYAALGSGTLSAYSGGNSGNINALPNPGTSVLNYTATSATSATYGAASRTVHTLRSAVGATSITMGNSSSTIQLTADGILNVGTGLLTIARGGSGVGSGMVVGPNLELVLNAANSGIYVSAPIFNNSGGASAVTVLGSAGVILGGTNNYTGDTVVAGGTLTLSNVLALQYSTLNFNNYGGGLSFGGLTSATMGGLRGSQNLGLTNAAGNAVALTVNAASDTTYSGNLSGIGSLVVKGAGTYTLSGSNSFTGNATIGAGGGAAVVRASGSNALGTGTIVFDTTGNASTARLELIDNRVLTNNITFSGRNNTSVGIQSISGNNTLGGAITLSVGGGTYLVQSDADLLTLGTAGNTAITSLGNKVLTLQGAGNGIVAGNIVPGAGVSVTKAGSGTWTLAGTNTYAGATMVNEGKLVITGGGGLLSTNIVVASGATLDVSGLASVLTLTGTQAVQDSGTILGSVASASTGVSFYPGLSGTANTLTFGGSLSLSGGATVYFDVSGSYNSGNDQIVVGGDLTLSSSDAIHINAMTGGGELDVTGDYVLFAVTGSTTMATTPIIVWDGTAPANYLNYSLVKSGNNVVLRYSASTAPAVTATATPSSLTRYQSTTIAATVAPGSTGVSSVKVDLSAIGGSASASLILSDTANVYTNTFLVSAATAPGSKNLTVLVTDNTSPTPLTGTYILGLSISPVDQVWVGAGSDSTWSNHLNWASGASPVAGEGVTFAGAARLTPDMETNYSVNGVNFDASAGSFTMGSSTGGILSLTGSGITNASANPQTVSVLLTMVSNQVFNAAAGSLSFNTNITNGGKLLTVAGAANTTIAGSVYGSGGLTKTDNGTLTLAATNAFTGNLFGKGGTVIVGSGAAVNTGSSYISIGQSGSDVATLTLKGNGTLTNTSDFNVGDVEASSGTLNVQDNASLTVNALFVGSANSSSSTASGVVNQTGGSVTEVSSAVGMFAIGGRTSTSGSGTYNMSGGTLTAAAGIRVGGTGTGTFNQTGGTVVAKGGINIARISGSTGTYNLNGGTLSSYNVTSSTSANATFNFDGGILQALTPGNPWMSALSSAYVLERGAIIDTVTNSPRITQALLDGGAGGGLVKLGAGTLYLEGGNTYTGTTVVSNGTLAGIGSLAGSVLVASNGVISAGDSGSTVGTLTVTGGLTIQGGALFRISKTGGTLTSDAVSGLTSASYGGRLTITNITTDSTALVAGDSFTLFSVGTHSGNFTNILGSAGSNLGFAFTNGVLSVVSTLPGTPTNLTFSASGGALSLSWPSEYRGWILQAQTNAVNVGLSNNWVDVEGSSALTATNISVDAAQGAVFFRLRHP